MSYGDFPHVSNINTAVFLPFGTYHKDKTFSRLNLLENFNYLCYSQRKLFHKYLIHQLILYHFMIKTLSGKYDHYLIACLVFQTNSSRNKHGPDLIACLFLKTKYYRTRAVLFSYSICFPKTNLQI